MIVKYRNKALTFGVPGVALQLVGGAIGVPVLGWLIAAVGTVMLCFALSFWAKAKGRSIAWGALGFFPFVGVLVLALIGDEHERPRLNA